MGDYSNQYSEASFWNKIKSMGKSIPLLRNVIAMFYALTDQNTPLWVKAIIVGALGYFISPIDAVPDFLPVAGYGDDAAVVGSALAVISAYVTKEHYEKADRFLS